MTNPRNLPECETLAERAEFVAAQLRVHMPAGTYAPYADRVMDLVTAFRQLGRELRQARWIPVSERLPDFDQYVLWCHASGNCFIEALDKDDDFAQDYVNVTHWMPLPTPPASGEK